MKYRCYPGGINCHLFAYGRVFEAESEEEAYRIYRLFLLRQHVITLTYCDGSVKCEGVDG